MKHIDQFINDVFAEFTPKQRKVLTGRFGLKTGKRSTLQEIGDELGITRERVRQIEEQAIGKIREQVRKDAKELVDSAVAHLNAVDGVRRDDVFIEEMKKTFDSAAIKYVDQKLRFVFMTAGIPLYQRETDAAYPYWFIDEAAKKRFVEFVQQMTQFFKSGDRNQILREKTYLSLCKGLTSCHFLSIPKQFGENVFGDIGLREWPEIEPKTMRDKAYLVLKKHGQPLHFEGVAKSINDFGLDKKRAHIQTVHNELIKDARFVLVGRGMYGLREHGFEPGTVREVIVSLLKKHGPLSSSEVVQLVNKQRFLKVNTILLSLQNRKHFKRLENNKYSIKEA